VTAISVGDSSVCAAIAGAAKCWSTGDYDIAGATISTAGLGSGVTAIASGYGETYCAVVSGLLKCWGKGYYGQIGDGNAWAVSPTAIAEPAVPGTPLGGGGGGGSGGSSGGAGSGGGVAPVPVAPSIGGAPAKAKPGKAIALAVSCPAGCTLALKLKIGRKSVPGLKSLAIPPGSTTAKVTLPSKVVKKIKAALKKNRMTKVTLTITPTATAGAGAAKTVKIG
jgi:hypothetical protein